jgi:hemerythrin
MKMMTESWNKPPNDYEEWQSKESENIGQELRRLWLTEIKHHFRSEEEFLLKYGQKVGYNGQYIARILQMHKLMEKLIWKGGPESLRDFEKALADYIRFKGTSFAERIENAVESNEEPPKDDSDQVE